MKGIAFFMLLVLTGCTNGASQLSLNNTVQTDQAQEWANKRNGSCGPNIVSDFNLSISDDGQWHAIAKIHSRQLVGRKGWESTFIATFKDKEKSRPDTELTLFSVTPEPEQSLTIDEAGKWEQGGGWFEDLNSDDVLFRVVHRCHA